MDVAAKGVRRMAPFVRPGLGGLFTRSRLEVRQCPPPRPWTVHGGAGVAELVEKSSRERGGWSFVWATAAVGILSISSWFPVAEASAAEDAGDLAEGDEEAEECHTVVNWSGTHQVSVPPGHFFEPETTEELERLVAEAHLNGRSLRPLGSALSPNGIAFSSGGMVSLAQLDRVLHVDKEKKQVTVEAGARVSQVVEELKKHGLTLQNFASIAEQQIGGFISVGAHGTGAGIPPVDEQVVSLKLVTPSEGTVVLGGSGGTAEEEATFKLARVGLGALGVVSEVTLQCVDNHKLLEDTFVLSRAEIRRRHQDLLRQYRHMRYMWIPYTDSVVVVGSNPCPWDTIVPPVNGASPLLGAMATGRTAGHHFSEFEKVEPLRDLLEKTRRQPSAEQAPMAQGMNFSQLRDELLAVDTLDTDHVIAVNTAEAEFWRRNQGSRVDESLNILQFDCGGQQRVYEVVFPSGTVGETNFADIDFMEELLNRIERSRLPAPAPIEQRWTCSSSSPMSPASSPDTDTLQSWVGIIMYIPTVDSTKADRIARRFGEYCRLEASQLPRYGAQVHWAKIEPPAASDEASLAATRASIAARFPVHNFNVLRQRYDPKGIMSNDLINLLLGQEGSGSCSS